MIVDEYDRKSVQGMNILLNEKTSAVRSRISSKLIFASCVGYFDREYVRMEYTSIAVLRATFAELAAKIATHRYLSVL